MPEAFSGLFPSQAPPPDRVIAQMRQRAEACSKPPLPVYSCLLSEENLACVPIDLPQLLELAFMKRRNDSRSGGQLVWCC